jgi:hypothetical protein
MAQNANRLLCRNSKLDSRLRGNDEFSGSALAENWVSGVI